MAHLEIDGLCHVWNIIDILCMDASCNSFVDECCMVVTVYVLPVIPLLLDAVAMYGRFLFSNNPVAMYGRLTAHPTPIFYPVRFLKYPSINSTA